MQKSNSLKRPVAVIPMNDPDGSFFPHLVAITPLLKQLFSQLFVSVNMATQQNQPEYVDWLGGDDFFHVFCHKTEVTTIGEDFLSLYGRAASACDPDQVLHLCLIDRVAYALQSEYRTVFIADIQAVTPQQTPLIFQRSELAWQTHPRNYREAEQMVITAGEWLFDRSLEFAWCHIAVQAHQLSKAIATVQNRDMSFFAEIVLALREDVKTKAVDWLAWEDPFITSGDAQELKRARETSIDETHKRLGYVIPMLQLLNAASKE